MITGPRCDASDKEVTHTSMSNYDSGKVKIFGFMFLKNPSTAIPLASQA
jgi:hypothetical protein